MTADAVSWVAGRTTSQPKPTSSSISFVNLPTYVPGMERGMKMSSGNPRVRIRSLSQSFVSGLTSCVEVALVYSDFLTPVRRKWK